MAIVVINIVLKVPFPKKVQNLYMLLLYNQPTSIIIIKFPKENIERPPITDYRKFLISLSYSPATNPSSHLSTMQLLSNISLSYSPPALTSSCLPLHIMDDSTSSNFKNSRSRLEAIRAKREGLQRTKRREEEEEGGEEEEKGSKELARARSNFLRTGRCSSSGKSGRRRRK